MGGLLFAYYLDFSIGPAIALFLGVVLIIASLLAKGAGSPQVDWPDEDRLVATWESGLSTGNTLDCTEDAKRGHIE